MPRRQRTGETAILMPSRKTERRHPLTPSETDMLVKRLNDSIARALEKVQEMAQRGPSCLIDHETDVAARKIESAEQASMQEWIENHSVLDEDGRVRC